MYKIKTFICFSPQIAEKAPNRGGNPNIGVKTKVQSISFKSYFIIFIVSGHPCIDFYNDTCFNLLSTRLENGKGGFLDLRKRDHKQKTSTYKR